jgi:glutathione S-transferase
MSIVFYTAPFSSASPVVSALVELGVPFERVSLDLAAGEQRRPEFLKLNPNGKVPTLVVEGTPMFEALAILLWLGETYGVKAGLWPANKEPARLQALSWCTWAYVTYGTCLVRLQYATSERFAKELHSPAQAKSAQEQLVQLLDVLEARLAAGPCILGEDYSLVDLVVGSVIGYGVHVGVSVQEHPRVKAWLEAFQARASYASAMAA